jgi:hypothetical protein
MQREKGYSGYVLGQSIHTFFSMDIVHKNKHKTKADQRKVINRYLRIILLFYLSLALSAIHPALYRQN